MSGGRLFQRIREIRGINYGDYAYIEYFPRGGNVMEPPPNVARSSQAFQIWIRPAEPPQAAFTLRLAVYELNKLVKDGIPQEDFDRTKEFLSKYVNVLTKTKRAELAYAIDSLYYGIPNYNTYVKNALPKLTRDQVNAAIRKHLRADRLQIVAVTRQCRGSEAADRWRRSVHDRVQFAQARRDSGRRQDRRGLRHWLAAGGHRDRAGGEDFRITGGERDSWV